MPPANLHGAALVIGDRGVFIRGRSGAGKTGLALELLRRAAARGLHARLVADDQVFVSIAGERLVMTVPDSIAGLVEIRGLGVRPIAWQRRTVVDLVVTLVDPADAERMPDPAVTNIHGVELLELRLAEQASHDAASIIMVQLNIGLFDTVHMRQNG